MYNKRFAFIIPHFFAFEKVLYYIFFVIFNCGKSNPMQNEFAKNKPHKKVRLSKEKRNVFFILRCVVRQNAFPCLNRSFVSLNMPEALN